MLNVKCHAASSIAAVLLQILLLAGYCTEKRAIEPEPAELRRQETTGARADEQAGQNPPSLPLPIPEPNRGKLKSAIRRIDNRSTQFGKAKN